MAHTSPLNISVVIPVYGVSAYIERCLTSVMAQTCPCTECLIVDDASPDDSLDKCERLIADYRGPTRFRMLHHAHNRGLSAARNTGTDAAEGDYIFYLDGDDALAPDCLEKLAAPIRRDAGIELVQGNCRCISEGCSVCRVPTLPETELASREAVRQYFFRRGSIPVTVWNKLVKRDFLRGNYISFIEGLLFEDHPWMFSLLKHLNHLYVVADVTYLHYGRPGSIMTATDQRTRGLHLSRVYEEIATHLSPGDEPREAAYYVRACCRFLCRYPDIPAFQRAAAIFRRALSDGRHRRERFYLWVAGWASRCAWLRAPIGAVLFLRRKLRATLHRLRRLWSASRKSGQSV